MAFTPVRHILQTPVGPELIPDITKALGTLSVTFGGATYRNGQISAFAHWNPDLFGVVLDACLLPNTGDDGTSSTTQPRNSIDPPFPPVWPYFFSTEDIYGRERHMTDFVIVRGDTRLFKIQVFQDSSQTPYDLTGSSLRMTAKWKVEDADGAAVFVRTSPLGGITFTNAVEGLAEIEIVPSNTSGLPAHRVELPYDLQITSPTNKVYTVLRGRYVVLPDASVTTP